MAEIVDSPPVKVRPKRTDKRDRIAGGESFYPGESLTSANGQFRFILQDDSNLCLYSAGNDTMWTSNTVARGADNAFLGPDGEFVLKTEYGSEIWSSRRRSPNKNAQAILLQVQDDGDVVVKADGEVFWSTNTAASQKLANSDRLAVGETLRRYQSLVSPSGTYRLVMNDYGSVDLRGERSTLWAPWNLDPSDEEAVSELVMGADGNLKLLMNKTERWTSQTGGRGDNTSCLIVQDDGNMVIRSKDVLIWSTNTQEHDFARRTERDRLAVGQVLEPGDSLVSPNGRYRLRLSDKGNLVLYDGRKQIWAGDGREEEEGKQPRLKVYTNGALVVADRKHSVWWSSDTVDGGDSSTFLILLDTGDLQLRLGNRVIWSPTQRDHLTCGKSLEIEANEILKAGDYELSINAEGIFCSKDVVTGKSTYYYPENAVSGAKFLNFSYAIQLDVFTNRGPDGSWGQHDLAVMKPREGTIVPHQAAYYWTTQFRLDHDGIGRMYILGKEVWSLDQLANGPTPTRP